MGNRLTSTAVAGAWTYNDNNELQSYNGVSFTYDANGNTIGKIENGVVWTYTYNVENRIVAAESQNVSAQYYYDPFGRRLWKEVDGVRTYYMYADEGLVAEMDASGNATKTYGWKPGGTWGTDPLFMKVNEAYYYYHNDHLGTPQKLTDADGATVWSALYSSFGKAQVIPASTVTNNLRFPGQYYDAETGLYYNRFRYYDPEIGRYLRNDPIINDINLYGYVQNNPLNIIDIYGLQIFDPRDLIPFSEFNFPSDLKNFPGMELLSGDLNNISSHPTIENCMYRCLLNNNGPKSVVMSIFFAVSSIMCPAEYKLLHEVIYWLSVYSDVDSFFMTNYCARDCFANIYKYDAPRYDYFKNTVFEIRGENKIEVEIGNEKTNIDYPVILL